MARNRVVILGGTTLVAGAAVALWLAMSAREAPVAGPQSLIPQTPIGAAPTPAAVASVAEAQNPVAPNAEAASTPEVLPAPSFDVVRISAEGEALVAGNAMPGAAITLRVDGSTVAQAAADAAGQFVALFSLGYSDTMQVMTLEMADAQGRRVEAPDTVMLTPRPAPLAEATPVVEAEAAVAEAGAVVEATPVAEAATAAEPSRVADATAVAETVPSPEAAPLAEAVQAADGAQSAEAAPLAEVAPALAQTAPAQGEAPETLVARAEDAVTPLAASAEPATASSPTAILMRGDGRVEVLDRAPQVMDNVVIDAISYSDAGDVQISGRAAGGDPAGTLRIYLDNQPVALARAESGDWTLDLPAVDAGIYTLRVDQLSAEGGVVSRFETPFLRESPEALAQARARSDTGQAAPSPAQLAAAEPATASPAATDSGPVAVVVPEPPRPSAALITVQPGHTLWAISRDRYGQGERFMVIFNANRSQIRDPDLIYPGQVFALPGE